MKFESEMPLQSDVKAALKNLSALEATARKTLGRAIKVKNCHALTALPLQRKLRFLKKIPGKSVNTPALESSEKNAGATTGTLYKLP